MAATLDDELAILRRINAELEQKLSHRTAERDEALAQQTATAEVLQVINSSPGELAPVFDAMLERAMRLCDAAFGGLFISEGERFRAVATRGVPGPLIDFARKGFPIRSGRLLRGDATVHFADLREAPLDRYPELLGPVKLGRARTMLNVALRQDDDLLGFISLFRQEVRPFADEQIALVQNFAAQAVIAMENARLLGELRQRTHDLEESLEYQTATSDVLKVISQSTLDLQPVLDTLVETAARICRAESGFIFRLHDCLCRMVASFGIPTKYREFQLANPITPNRGTLAGRVVIEQCVVHIADAAADPEYTRVEAVQLGRQRTMLGVPLVREDTLVGVITLARSRAEPFIEKEIALVRTFADQAVIAMENARLLTETREALEQQTATAEVLQVINSSPGELAPVFDAMLEKATRLCQAGFGILWTYDCGSFYAAALCGVPAAYAQFLSAPIELADSAALGDIARGHKYVHVTDLATSTSHRDSPLRRATVDLGGARTGLAVPLVKDEAVLGIFVIYRQEVRPFTTEQIRLLQNFASQAVIAMENARLLGELRARTSDLEQSLEYRTATSDVLQVISRSTFDLQPMLDTLMTTAARLCNAEAGHITRREGEVYRVASTFALVPEWDAMVRQATMRPDDGTLVGRVALERQTIHIDDIAAAPNHPAPEVASLGKLRTLLGVPLLREAEPIGVISLARQRVEPFTERQIELVRTFADQAVIAIENVRLLTEIRQAQAELRVTFDNMGDGVAMFDANLRLAAWNRNFQRLLDLPTEFLATRPNLADYFQYLAARGEYVSPDLEADIRRMIERGDTEFSLERTRPDGRVIEVRRNSVPDGGFVLIYSDITERKRSEAEIRAARDAAEAAYRDLKAAQASLIQAEKMASLGQLTAGIAHEIKNPLNFVNNFAELSVGLLDELKETAAPAIASLADEQRADVDDVIGLLTSNLEKIAGHGRRADGIVKSMLEHSRGNTGERRTVDLNNLVEESLNLAYHGARAQDASFNISLERDFADAIPPIELVPQDITRVCLNLISNGFYAATRRGRQDSDPKFEPTLKVTTRDLGDTAEIRVRDNGVGIPPEVKDKLFQPFFTTKPTGEGTGLGLSISYDIVTQQHGGTIEVDSSVNEFTEFRVRLPHAPRTALAQAGLF